MAGLLAARVLSDFYESVTVVERDVLPAGPLQRRGVSQGHHLHQMLSGGVRYLVDFFPGILDELEAAGATVLYDPDDPTLFHLGVGDVVFCQTGRFKRSDGLTMLMASRPLLESIIRRRVRSIANVSFDEGHDVAEPVVDDAGRVTGAHVADRATGVERVVAADLVVDTTGRAARTPAFLAAHGYPRPAERKYSVRLSYSSQFFRLPVGVRTQPVVLDIPTLATPKGAGLMAYEDGTAIVTVIGLGGLGTPTDLTGLLESVAESFPSDVVAVLRACEPIGDVTTQRYPASVWRRYHGLTRFPPGYLVMGDAVCSFNPLYGQGMTSAALQAAALRTCLTAGTDDLGLRFFRAAARKLAPIWWANRVLDFASNPYDDWRASVQKLVDRGMAKVYAAAATDLVVAETIYRQMQLAGHPTDILRPGMLRRVVAVNRRRVR